MKYYTIQMWGCVEPVLYGPYNNPLERVEQTKKIEEISDPDHSWCKLDIDENGNPEVYPFTNTEL